MDGSTFANTSIEAPLYCAEQIKVPEALPVSGNASIVAVDGLSLIYEHRFTPSHPSPALSGIVERVDKGSNSCTACRPCCVVCTVFCCTRVEAGCCQIVLRDITPT